MASEQQYYQAKVFLKAYNDAFRTLQDISLEQNQLNQLKTYEDLLLTSSKTGAIKIRQGNIQKGKNFDNSFVKRLSNFSKEGLKKNLSGFQQAKSTRQLAEIFQAYLKKIGIIVKYATAKLQNYQLIIVFNKKLPQNPLQLSNTFFCSYHTELYQSQKQLISYFFILSYLHLLYIQKYFKNIMSRSNQGHQYFITVFSPEGRLYQVQYAFKAVKNCGLTGLGVRAKDSVILISEKKVPDRFIDPETVTSLHYITPKVGALAIGISPDTKNVVTRLKLQAANYKTEFGHDIPIDFLASRLADYNQINTQKAMQRVFGVQTIIAGIDQEKGPALFKVDPAGYYFGYKGVASGVKEQDSVNFMQKQMKKKGWDLNQQDAIKLAITTLQSVIGQQFKSNDIEIGVVSQTTGKFNKLDAQRIEYYLNEVAKKD